MVRFDSVEERRAAMQVAADEFEAEDETEGLLAIGY